MLLMRSIAQELAPYRIRVNSIAPGAIRIPINVAAWSTPEAYKDLMTLVPDKRIGEPDDIARAAVWLASDAADYVTGATLFVDGRYDIYPGLRPAADRRSILRFHANQVPIGIVKEATIYIAFRPGRIREKRVRIASTQRVDTGAVFDRKYQLRRGHIVDSL